MSREMTNKEAISNLNQIYGIVSPDIQRSLDVAFKALEERPKGEWIKWNFKTFGAMGDWEYKCSNCGKVYGGEYNFCPNCGAEMRKPNCVTCDHFGKCEGCEKRDEE